MVWYDEAKGRVTGLESIYCFGSFQGDKKACRFRISLYLEQKSNDISGDLNTVAFTAPQLLNPRAREGRS